MTASTITRYFVVQQLHSQVSQTHAPPSWQHSHPLTQAQFASVQQEVDAADAARPATVAPVAASSASVLDVRAEPQCVQAFCEASVLFADCVWQQAQQQSSHTH